jgi:hypothetical protein
VILSQAYPLSGEHDLIASITSFVMGLSADRQGSGQGGTLIFAFKPVHAEGRVGWL